MKAIFIGSRIRKDGCIEADYADAFNKNKLWTVIKVSHGFYLKQSLGGKQWFNKARRSLSCIADVLGLTPEEIQVDLKNGGINMTPAIKLSSIDKTLKNMVDMLKEYIQDHNSNGSTTIEELEKCHEFYRLVAENFDRPALELEDLQKQVASMTEYTCPICGRSYTAKRWNEQTEKDYGEGITNIEDNAAFDKFYSCPGCEAEEIEYVSIKIVNNES